MTEYSFILGSAQADRLYATHFGLYFSAVCLGIFLLIYAWDGYALRRKVRKDREKTAERIDQYDEVRNLNRW